jgi:uncharacterized damage-inducible protein DinB
MDHLLIDLDRELAATRRVLERFPDGQGDWTPHDKSRTLSALASHVATIPQHGARVLTTEEMDIATRQPPPVMHAARDLLNAFESGISAFKAAIAGADPARFDQKWTLRMGGKVIIAEPRALLMRTMVINHLVHHRAQLGVYYRLLNVPVPGVYGPSADEPIAP